MSWDTEPIQLTLIPPPTLQTGMCTVSVQGRRICREPQAYRVEIGCEHEHVGYGRTCKMHLRHLTDRRARCDTCRRDFNHVCYLGSRAVERL